MPAVSASTHAQWDSKRRGVGGQIPTIWPCMMKGGGCDGIGKPQDLTVQGMELFFKFLKAAE